MAKTQNYVQLVGYLGGDQLEDKGIKISIAEAARTYFFLGEIKAKQALDVLNLYYKTYSKHYL